MIFDAYLNFFFYWAFINFFPFKTYRNKFGIYGYESPMEELDQKSKVKLRSIKKAVLIASKNFPVRCTCLMKALATKKILQKNGLSSTIYLGMTLKKETPHAWLRCGNIIVTGKNDHQKYGVTAFFGDK